MAEPIVPYRKYSLPLRSMVIFDACVFQHRAPPYMRFRVRIVPSKIVNPQQRVGIRVMIFPQYYRDTYM